MLIVPVYLNSSRQLGEMRIGRVVGGAQSDYLVEVATETGLVTAEVHGYPRWSASVWDLVARGLAAALYGEETIGKRPTPINVPVHRTPEGQPYVRAIDIPQLARSAFEYRMRYSTRPGIAGESSRCYWAWDWEAFIEGQ